MIHFTLYIASKFIINNKPISITYNKSLAPPPKNKAVVPYVYLVCDGSTAMGGDEGAQLPPQAVRPATHAGKKVQNVTTNGA